METIILFGVLEGLIMFLLIILKRRKSVSDFWLSSFFLIFSLNTFMSHGKRFEY